ncbi:hypothetical protein DFQ27_006276 [Actinomortierella ambigua]|uniref:Uncharacterized protein n=1 Tax=Actinomortierella ambigua TaxID=1343610 RepID=A0A9P6PZ00_9FUNG|nr:hypothetical protein DFQ27_006276 [Actinomortierella ambigua]
MKTFSTLIIAALALFSSELTDGAPVNKAKSGKTIAIVDTNRFCTLLPPKWGGGISESEDVAVAFCTQNMPLAPNANIFPTGFIVSAHAKTNNDSKWIQITGRIDRSKYGLSASDEGGQNDPKAPTGSKCAGYPYYVGFVEPSDNIYCIRCCQNKSDCPVNKSTYGCKKILPGDYS